jgi:hypothetical protein
MKHTTVPVKAKPAYRGAFYLALCNKNSADYSTHIKLGKPAASFRKIYKALQNASREISM